MTTFDQARQIVRAEILKEYPSLAGITVSDSGLENAQSFQVFVEIDSSEYRRIEDGPAHVVDKATGAYSRLWGFQAVIPDATSCGAPDPDEEL